MADIASLGIKVTTDGVQQAQSDLDKLAASGDKAAASTDKLNKSFGQGQGQPARQASVAVNEQTAALAKLIGQIDPTVAALEKLDQQQAKLAAFRKSGALSADDFTTYSAAIDASRSKLDGASESVSHFTLNNANARRELGYLAKDIATGQWGRLSQSFSTLLSQSGVLGLAFSATGLAIAALAAPLALFAVGAVKGQQESEKLRVDVIATGDAAGVSAAEFNQMAVAVGKATGEWSDARKAVEDLAASGKVAGAGISGLAQTAVNMATVTGESVDKSVAKLLEIGDAPTAAIAKLNEQYHFLTSAQYAHIAALEEEGRTEDAARIAQAAAADAFAERAKQVVDNSGWLVTAAHSVADAWGSAWDAIKGVGRTPGLAEQVQEVQGKIDALLHPQAKTDRQGNLVQGNNAGAAADDPRVVTLQNQLADLRKQQFDGGLADVNKSLDASANQSAIAAQARLSAFKDPKTQLDDSLKRANADKLAALYGVVDPDAKAKIISEYNTQVQDARDAYAAALKKGNKADPLDPLNSLVNKAVTKDNVATISSGQGDSSEQAKLLQEQVTQLQALADAGGKAIEKGADLAKVQAQVAAGVSATNDYFAKQAEILSGKNIAAMDAYNAALDKQNEALQRNIDSQIAQVGMGDKEYRQQQQINDIYTKSADAIEKLNAQRNAPGANTSLIDQQIAAVQANTDKQVKIVQTGYAGIDAAQGDWLNGAKRAMANYEDAAANVAGQTQSIFTSAFNNMSDSIATFATTGKLNFKSLATSILSDLARMEARIATSKILSGIAGLFGGGASGGSLGGSSADYSGINNGELSSNFNFAASAKGNVFSSPGLSAYSGQIVSTPTMFAFAKGAGLMGEAGPEAIMPLTRGPDGKLGVQSSGSGGGVVVNQTINIDNSGSGSETTSGDNNAVAKQFSDRMKAVSKQAIFEELRPGGLLWKSRNG